MLALIHLLTAEFRNGSEYTGLFFPPWLRSRCQKVTQRHKVQACSVSWTANMRFLPLVLLSRSVWALLLMLVLPTSTNTDDMLCVQVCSPVPCSLCVPWLVLSCAGAQLPGRPPCAQTPIPLTARRSSMVCFVFNCCVVKHCARLRNSLCEVIACQLYFQAAWSVLIVFTYCWGRRAGREPAVSWGSFPAWQWGCHPALF